MKTSQKIILIAALIITSLMIVSMVVIRDDIQTIFNQKALADAFEQIPVEKFESVDFSANWSVVIRQGTEHKLEISSNDKSSFQPVIKNIDGTLYFAMDTTQLKESTGKLRAKITAPTLKAISSVSGTQIHLSNFQSDSLTVSIEDGCVFTGTDNTIKHLSFKSSGDARIQLNETPDF
jgi:hypothetical protein